ncbi:Glycosyltransferase [Limosilactobacillus equigenerosi DSM 18793 = JCM 14505]|uniref:Glycosyltransferase n=1 Tax=Limosilactobacillus equigenerosi DSM 18793 = JCM 14505 TaxID=1423742 RepID=A0A0R1UPU8_9LACO|nr:Glycosyltransferase [Limosilactobacillus equigenerosi DSM 18793 = JCM 14505]
MEKVVDKIKSLETEYWFIDDGSSDQTLSEIKKINVSNPNQVHYVTFSRNFGKEAALYAGLQAATGDYVVVMDVDLQDPPEYLVEMYETLSTTDYDCVGTRRTSRTGEAKLKSFLSDKFYDVINRISNTNIVNGARDYRMMTRQMVDAILSMTEYDRFSKGIFSWVGFKTRYLEYENVERVAGNTSWSMRKLFKYAFDGIMDFSQAPLSLAVWIGGASFILSLIGVVFVVIRHFVAPATSVFGWASLVSIILMIGGLQLLCLGIIGKYIGKIYLQVKNRPIYIVKEKK